MELPFQWDDGRFIAPFVASGEDDLGALSEWLLTRSVLPALEALQDHAPAASDRLADTLGEGAVTVHLDLVDWGCGDGSVLFFLSQHLATLWQTRVTTAAACPQGEQTRACQQLANAHLRISAVGIELDDELVERAKERARTMPPAPPTSSTTYTFACEDMQRCELDGLFPPYTAQAVSHGSSRVVRAQPALYLYLLPDGLATVRDTLVDISSLRKWLVLSNRWPVAHLAECTTAEAVGNITIHKPYSAQT